MRSYTKKKKVADIRVLALGYATAEITKDIRAFSKKNHEFVMNAIEAYEKESDESFGQDKPAFVEHFNFHDCWVDSFEQREDDLYIALDDSSSLTNTKGILLKDFVVAKQNESYIDARWLYEEIYKTEKGFEIHVLLHKKELIELIVSATSVELVS